MTEGAVDPVLWASCILNNDVSLALLRKGDTGSSSIVHLIHTPPISDCKMCSLCIDNRWNGQSHVLQYFQK